MDLKFRKFFECGEEISDFLDGNKLIMFLTKGKEIYGAPEESRLVFARLKSPDEQWMDDAKFIALDLLKSIAGEPKQVVFGGSDLDDLNIIQRDDVINKLMKVKR